MTSPNSHYVYSNPYGSPMPGAAFPTYKSCSFSLVPTEVKISLSLPEEVDAKYSVTSFRSDNTMNIRLVPKITVPILSKNPDKLVDITTGIETVVKLLYINSGLANLKLRSFKEFDSCLVVRDPMCMIKTGSGQVVDSKLQWSVKTKEECWVSFVCTHGDKMMYAVRSVFEPDRYIYFCAPKDTCRLSEFIHRNIFPNEPVPNAFNAAIRIVEFALKNKPLPMVNILTYERLHREAVSKPKESEVKIIDEDETDFDPASVSQTPEMYSSCAATAASSNVPDIEDLPCSCNAPHPGLICPQYQYISNYVAARPTPMPDPNYGYWPEDEEFTGVDDHEEEEQDPAQVVQKPESKVVDEFDGWKFGKANKKNDVKKHSRGGAVKISYSPNSKKNRNPDSVVARFSKSDEWIVENIKLDHMKHTPGLVKAQLRRMVDKKKGKSVEPNLKSDYVNDFINAEQSPEGLGDWFSFFQPKVWVEAAADTLQTKMNTWYEDIKTKVSKYVEDYGSIMGMAVKVIITVGGIVIGLLLMRDHPVVGGIVLGVMVLLAGFFFSENIAKIVGWDKSEALIKKTITDCLKTTPVKPAEHEMTDVASAERLNAEQVYEMDENDLSCITTALSGFLACATVGPEVYKMNPKGFATAIGKWPSTKKGVSELVPFVSDLIVTGVNKIRVLFGYSKIETITESHRQFGEWAKNANEFLQRAATNNMPVTHENQDQLGKLLAEGRHHLLSLQEIPQADRIKMSMNMIMHQLASCVSSFSPLGYGSCGMRQMPVAVYIYGPSGVGKSSLVGRLSKIATARVLPPERLARFLKNPDVEIYSRQVETKYADGYYNQLCYCYDDIFQSKVQQADSEAMDVIRTTNMYTHMLHMAGMLQKGNTMFTSTLIMATGNDICIHDETVRHPEAVARRFELKVEMVLRDEYKNDKGQLDVAKVKAKGPNFVDYCVFRPYEIYGDNVVPRGDSLTFDDLVDEIVERYQAKMSEYKDYTVGTAHLLEKHAALNMYKTTPGLTPQAVIDNHLIDSLQDYDNNELNHYRYYIGACRPIGWDFNLIHFQNTLFEHVKAFGLFMPAHLSGNVANTIAWYRSIAFTIMKFIPNNGLNVSTHVKWATALYIMMKMSNDHSLTPEQWVYLLTNDGSAKCLLDSCHVDLVSVSEEWTYTAEVMAHKTAFDEWIKRPEVAKFIKPTWDVSGLRILMANNDHMIKAWEAMDKDRKSVV